MSTTAETFRALHEKGAILILPNAWDCASARITEAAGAKAIATSSAAIAWAHGFGDGQQLPVQTLLTAVREIVATVRVPVSVDFEAGYADDPTDNIAALLEAGAVGLNLEDGGDAPEVHAKRIAAARKAADRAGIALFINARTDVYLRKLVAPERAAEECLVRGMRYEDAGASGLFVPGCSAQPDIEAICRGTKLPVNLMALPQLAPAKTLQQWGVRRLSAGSSLSGATFAFVRRAATEMLTEGTMKTIFEAPLPWAELNALMKR